MLPTDPFESHLADHEHDVEIDGDVSAVLFLGVREGVFLRVDGLKFIHGIVRYPPVVVFFFAELLKSGEV